MSKIPACHNDCLAGVDAGVSLFEWLDNNRNNICDVITSIAKQNYFWKALMSHAYERIGTIIIERIGTIIIERRKYLATIKFIFYDTRKRRT